MAHDVFICHSAKDKTTADAVCAMLESSGIRCWIAPRDVTAGMEWSECIIDAIEECRVMVLVFTTNANESPQIRREVERAVNRGVAILPLRIEDILPGRALEYFIGNVHWLDAMTPPLESHLQNLAGTVKILLGRLPRHEAIPHAGVSQPVAIPPIEPTPQPDPTPQRTTTPERIAIPQPQRVEPIAPEKSEWTEPARPPVQQQIPVERAPETSSKAAPIQADAQQVTPSAKSASPKQKRAIGLVVIPIVVFLLSAVSGIAVGHDLIFGRFEPEMLAGVALCVAGILASCGVLTKKGWGRILLIILSAACAFWELILGRNAFVDLSNFISWIFALGLCALVIWYMSTARVKQEFAVAAAESQKHFASSFVQEFTPTGAAAAMASRTVSAKGAGPRTIPVVIIAILSFVEAGIWTLPIYGDYDRNRLAPKDFGAFLLICAAVAIGFGLIKLMGWARLLKIVVATVDAVLMISVAQSAFHEGGFGEASWIGIFIYIIWSALFMFTPRVKRAFSKVA